MSRDLTPEQLEQSLSTNSNAVVAMHRKFNIPGDVVFRATAELPDNQRSAIRGLHAWAVENDISIAEQAKTLGVSEATISLVYRGKYEAKLDNICDTYAKFLDLQAKRRESRRLPFIQTALSDRIWKVCDTAREFQKIAFIFSDSQVGKSEALKEYQRLNNHGSTVYVEMPTGGGEGNFMAKLAKIFKIGETSRMADLRRRIMDMFDDRMLLIVDEAHKAIPAPGNNVSRRSLNSIEFVREIFNERQCGVIFCATNVFRDAMEDGSVQRILKQTRRRRLCSIQLPPTPTRNDLNTFAAAYGLPPSSGKAREIEDQMVDREGLGMWLTVLRMAAKLSGERKQKMDWNHVVAADAGLKSLENYKG